MSFLSSPSRTRGHLLQPLHREARDAADQTSYVPHDEVRRRLGLPW